MRCDHCQLQRITRSLCPQHELTVKESQNQHDCWHADPAKVEIGLRNAGEIVAASCFREKGIYFPNQPGGQ